METLDFVKIALLFALFCGYAPLFGFLIRNRPGWQRGTFFVLCFLTIGGFFMARELGFTIHPILYRGTARGFHFFLAEVVAATLIWAQIFGNWKQFRLFPPGVWLYGLYLLATLLSLFNAPMPLYSMFAWVKDAKMVIIFIAAYNFVKTQDDLRFLLRSMAWVMLWQTMVVLKQKYIDHIHQVWGTFEHQNSLCMFTILIGMVFLAVAMGPKHKDSRFLLTAFVGCAVIVQSTLSRGGLAMFAMGTILVVVLSLIDRPTKRRLIVLSSLSCIAAIGLLFTMDSISARFNDRFNQESNNTRKMLNVSARMMFNDYKMGIGLNNFAYTINRPFPYGDHIDHWQRVNGNPVDPNYKKGVVESLWWLLLAETGIQGLLAYLLIAFTFLWWNIRGALYFRREYLGAVSIGMIVGFTMNYLQSFLERVLVQPRNMMLWFILLAVTARILTWIKTDKKLRISRRKAEREGVFQPERHREPEYA